METRLWTVHAKAGADLRVIPDRFDLLALVLPPVWAIWHGLWLSLATLVLVSGAVGMISPLAVSPVMYGAGLIAALEGASLRRFELDMRGWREVGVVEARTEEGAEEAYLTGQAATGGAVRARA